MPLYFSRSPDLVEISMTFDIRFVDIFSSYERWREFEQNAVMSPYQNSSWISAWYNKTNNNLNSEMQVFVVEGWQGDDLVFILPLQISNKLGITICKWFGPKFQNWNSGIFKRNWQEKKDKLNFSDVLSRIAEIHGNIDIFQLEKQRPQIDKFANPLTDVGCRILHADPIYIAEIAGSFKNWEENRRSKNSRKRLARKRNALQKAVGSITVQRAMSRPEVDNAFDTLFAQRERARKTRALPNPVSDVANLSALKQAAFNGLNSRNGLRVYTMTTSAKVLAVSCFITHDEHASAVISSMNENLAKFSVGRLIERDALEHLTIDGFRALDFGLGDDRYKQEWAVKEQVYDNLVAITRFGKLALYTLFIIGTCKRLLKSLTASKKIIRSIKSRYWF